RLDTRNADRARLLLAMTWLSVVEPNEEAIKRASLLLEERPDVRAALSPVVVMKYLASRRNRARLKRFRQVRKQLQEACPYAREHMLDHRGVLNPGLMPRTIEDLESIAPSREQLDAHRASLWNRLAEVWRKDDDFRKAVLHYATGTTELDAKSADLWPEVIYPLIERAHWQRKFRPRYEALWDYVIGKVLHIPLRGVRLDRMMVIAVPIDVVKQFDEDVFTVVDTPWLDEDDGEGPAAHRPPPGPKPIYVGGEIPREEQPAEDDEFVKVAIHLSPPEPFLLSQNSLQNLWDAAIQAQANASRPSAAPHRPVPVGPYQLAVAPIGQSRRSVRSVLQGLSLGKQIEIITPSLLPRQASRNAIAIWLYQDGSAMIVYLDFQHEERFILWHASKGHQFNFKYVAELKHILTAGCLEIPVQLDKALAAK
ncbi:hypothetical protein ACYOEI_30160, partial [Singulisphaera rosea]